MRVSFEMKLLKVILLHPTYLMWLSVRAQGKKCYIEACGRHKQHLSCTPFCNCHGWLDCLNSFTATREIAQSAKEENETDYIDSYLPDDSDNTKEETESDNIDSNLPDDSDDGVEQNNEDGVFLRTQFRTIWMSGNKYKEIRDFILFFVL